MKRLEYPFFSFQNLQAMLNSGAGYPPEMELLSEEKKEQAQASYINTMMATIKRFPLLIKEKIYQWYLVRKYKTGANRHLNMKLTLIAIADNDSYHTFR